MMADQHHRPYQQRIRADVGIICDAAAQVMGLQYYGCRLTSKVYHRRFKSYFGFSARKVAFVWNNLIQIGWTQYERSASPTHLLWALAYMKTYAPEHKMALDLGIDEKTFRKWAWFFMEGISELCSYFVSAEKFGCHVCSYNFNFACLVALLKIRWENRFRQDTYQRSLVTVDGTDFQIYEPSPFSTEWFSHKFDGPGLRYEIAVCINTGDIVWFNGPFPAGSHADVTIFRRNLKLMLGPTEMVVADAGYRDERAIQPHQYQDEQHKRAMDLARARHETING